MARIIATDNGPHSAEEWAITTAEIIFDLSNIQDNGRRLEARKFQMIIAELLLPHHNNNQISEQAKLSESASYINSEYDVSLYVTHVINEIITASKNTPWELHFSNQVVIDAVKNTISQHLITSQHIERLWHANRNPDCKISQEYKQKFNQ